jgi:hypothetical protein
MWRTVRWLFVSVIPFTVLAVPRTWLPNDKLVGTKVTVWATEAIEERRMRQATAASTRAVVNPMFTAAQKDLKMSRIPRLTGKPTSLVIYHQIRWRRPGLWSAIVVVLRIIEKSRKKSR